MKATLLGLNFRAPEASLVFSSLTLQQLDDALSSILGFRMIRGETEGLLEIIKRIFVLLLNLKDCADVDVCLGVVRVVPLTLPVVHQRVLVVPAVIVGGG